MQQGREAEPKLRRRTVVVGKALWVLMWVAIVVLAGIVGVYYCQYGFPIPAKKEVPEETLKHEPAMKGGRIERIGADVAVQPEILARGIVDEAGNLYGAKGVESVVWDSSRKGWIVTFSDICYHLFDFPTLATPFGDSTDNQTAALSQTPWPDCGKLIVYIWTPSAKRKGAFHFIVYSKE